MRNQIYKPQDIYKEVNGVSPDLLVYFENLDRRSIGTLGHEGYCLIENDTGLDGCNHAQFGLFIIYDPQKPGNNTEVKDALLIDIAPSILNCFDILIPEDFQGKIIQSSLAFST